MDFILDFEMLKLGIGLLGLIIINILLGSTDGLLRKEFNKEKFIAGIIKGGIVVVSFLGVYLIGSILVPEITIDINGQQITLLMAVNLILLSAFSIYAYEVLKKLAVFVRAKFNTTSSTTQK